MRGLSGHEKRKRREQPENVASSSRVSGGDVVESKENINEELQQALQPCLWSKQMKPKSILQPVAIQDKRRWRFGRMW